METIVVISDNSDNNGTPLSSAYKPGIMKKHEDSINSKCVVAFSLRLCFGDNVTPWKVLIDASLHCPVLSLVCLLVIVWIRTSKTVLSVANLWPSLRYCIDTPVLGISVVGGFDQSV
jgi:hypothetical protein